ncbi:nucleotide exchange factor GrpE [Candidatus Cyanaurora vandensis]|uniref:nucleotide exchange factor GrpE n=1 Tax=Candidatus Cyanaurora vandensis TaxID=2714958 RepID=UPI00257B214A|nr:nucleotide exchange factor GrpE [Candidatus Cyanaurora vandensis]
MNEPNPSASGTPLEEAQSGEIIRLVSVLDQTQAQLKDKEQQYARLYADFDNYRRRTQREKDEMKVTAAFNTLLELLPVLDNFERARLQIQPDTERETTLNNSYQAINKQLQAALEKVGLVPIEAVGKPFDPNLHEAILQEESPRYTQETVLAELQKGYYLGDKVLRPVIVKVATPIPGTVEVFDVLEDSP